MTEVTKVVNKKSDEDPHLKLIQEQEVTTNPEVYGKDWSTHQHLIDPDDLDCFPDENGKVASFTKYQQERLLAAKTQEVMMRNDTYDWLPRLTQLDKERLDTIEFLARALSEQEIKDYLLIDEIIPFSKFEERIFKMAYRRGTAKGKREAMEKLFVSMGTRQGGVIALAYLQEHAERFNPPSDGSNLTNPSGKKFTFNVNI